MGMQMFACMLAFALLSIGKGHAKLMCLTTQGIYYGGFSNSVSLLNTALDYSLKLEESFPGRFAWVFPPRFRPQSSHGFDDAVFDDIFSGNNSVSPTLVTEMGIPALAKDQFRCDRRSISYQDQATLRRKYYLYDHPKQGKKCTPEYLALRHPKFGLVQLSDPLFPQVAKELATIQFPSSEENIDVIVPESYEKCELIVPIPMTMIQWHHDYLRTRTRLQQQYYARTDYDGKPAAVRKVLDASKKPISIAVHQRLGDVHMLMRQDSGNALDKGLREKRMSAAWPLFCLAILEKVFPTLSSCAALHIFTDARAGHKDIVALRNFSMGIESFVHGGRTISQERKLQGPRPDDVSSRAAFDSMVYSDVLVAGGSGFGRLAGVLGRELVVAPPVLTNAHPLDYIEHLVLSPGVVDVPMLWDFEHIPNRAEVKNLVETSEVAHEMAQRLYELAAAGDLKISKHCEYQSPKFSDAKAEPFEVQQEHLPRRITTKKPKKSIQTTGHQPNRRNIEEQSMALMPSSSVESFPASNKNAYIVMITVLVLLSLFLARWRVKIVVS